MLFLSENFAHLCLAFFNQDLHIIPRKSKQVVLRNDLVVFFLFNFRLKIIPRYLQGFNCLNIDPSTTILGQKIAFPICAAPTGFQKVAHPDGELATARGKPSNYI